MKIGHKITIFYLFISLVSISLVSLFAYSSISREITNQTLNQLSATAANQEQKLNILLQLKKEKTIALANKYQLRTSLNNYIKSSSLIYLEELTEILNKSKTEIQDSTAITIVDFDGKVVSSTEKERLDSMFSPEEVVRRGKKSDSIVLSFDEIDAVEKLYFTYKVTFEGDLLGILIIEYPPDEIISLVKDYSGLGKTGETVLAKKDETGNAIFITSLRFDPDAAFSRTVKVSQVNSPVITAIKRSETVLTDALDYQNHKVLAATRYIDLSDWGLVVKMDIDEAFSSIQILRSSFISIISISSIIIIVLAYYFAQVITKPISKLTQVTQEIAKGDLSHKIDIKSKDEIGILAQSFNTMTDQLASSYHELESKVQERTKELEENKKELENKFTQIEEQNTSLENTKKAMLNLLEDSRHLEEELKEERDRARAIISSMGDGLIVVDRNYKIFLINDQAAHLLQMDKKDATGKLITNLVSFFQGEKEVHINDNPISKIFRENKEQAISYDLEDEIFLKIHTGRKFPVAVTVTSLIREEVRRAIIVFRDITVVKQLDEAKTGFISVASHQLRTPLTSIRWFSEMLISGDAGSITEDQKHFIERIYQDTDRMIALVNLLLQIARVEAGRVRIEPVPVDLKATTQGVLLTLKKNVEEKKQEILLQTQPDPFPTIPLDQEVVWQVIQNLISNASRYSPEKSTISISIVKKDGFAQYSVKDQGIGIPEKYQKRIFQKFFRAENALKYAPEGTGLGLSLAKLLVEGWGGRIWFESVKEEGTTFYFTIPLKGVKAKEGEVKLTV